MCIIGILCLTIFTIVIQIFTGVYGVGPATAKKWIKSGISSIEDAIESVDTLAKHDSRISAGNVEFICVVNKLIIIVNNILLN